MLGGWAYNPRLSHGNLANPVSRWPSKCLKKNELFHGVERQ